MRTLRRWSFRRRLSYEENLPAELATALWRGEADRLLFSSVPLQVKARCVVARYDGAGEPLLVKRHTWGGFWRTLRSTWREASARHCVRMATFLAEHGVPTPRPRACLEECFGPLGIRSYILSDYVQGTDLYHFIRYAEPSVDELRHVAGQVARIWQRLVELRVSHNDMKPENLIVDDSLGVWLIDFERVRRGGSARRHRSRQIADVQNFLHIRSWHRQSAARNIFLDQFLQSPYADWLATSAIEASSEVDAALSVAILCEGNNAPTSAQAAFESVRHIADEILFVAPSEGGRLDVLERVEPCGRNKTVPQWKLVLHQDEAVTPLLAKELSQRIAHRDAAVAFRIPIDHQFLGRSVSHLPGVDAQPIRLFRQDRCSYSLAGGRLTISVDPEQTDSLGGTIEKRIAATWAEFIDRLNERTTLAAARRLENGDRPRLASGVVCAFARFLNTYIRQGGIGCGWAGLQMALLESVFEWVEVAKLRQLWSAFPLDAASALEWAVSARGIAGASADRAEAA